MSANGPIVIIEDDQDDRELIATAIRNSGFNQHQLIFFENGQTALDYFCETKDKPFLIFCDINMPIMNGIELRSKINADDYLRKKSIPFIFLTTGSRPDDINTAYNLTIQGFFVKPASFQVMQQVINEILIYWSKCLHPNAK